MTTVIFDYLNPKTMPFAKLTLLGVMVLSVCLWRGSYIQCTSVPPYTLSGVSWVPVDWSDEVDLLRSL